ncbi:MAG: hypothetical protein FJ144_24400 [Deltaproteobacteria bacterium]|nr:hypothetical protein [Deltaproteobacteria bacterium]
MNDALRSKLESVPCNLCGGDDFQVLYDQPLRDQDPDDMGDFVASTDRYDAYGRIVRCNRCRLVHTNPRPRADTISDGYRKAVDPDYGGQEAQSGEEAQSRDLYICPLIGRRERGSTPNAPAQYGRCIKKSIDSKFL